MPFSKRVSVAKPAAKLGTFTVLSLSLLTVCTLCLALLCLSLQQKNSALSAEVKRLSASQILLMVPEEQAKPIADWLATHPDETQSLLDRVHPSAGQMPLVKVDGTKLTQDSALDALSRQRAEATAGDAPVNALLPMVLDHESLQLGPDQEMSAEMHEDPALNLATTHPVIQTENKQGIKVIVLPHGGIRVTTRDE
jgi:hypothetical protein